jgi:hypothetical protein
LKTREPLYGLCHHLNVYGNTPFADLSGAFPAPSVEALSTRVHYFTTSLPNRESVVRSCVFYRLIQPQHSSNVWFTSPRRALRSADGMLHAAGRNITDASLTPLALVRLSGANQCLVTGRYRSDPYWYCLLHATAFIHPLNIHCHHRIHPSFEHRT